MILELIFIFLLISVEQNWSWIPQKADIKNIKLVILRRLRMLYEGRKNYLLKNVKGGGALYVYVKMLFDNFSVPLLV